MKKALLLFFALAMTSVAYCQDTTDKKETEKPFTIIDTGPVYHKSCMRYVNNNEKLKKCNNNMITKVLSKSIKYPKGPDGNYINGSVLLKLIVKKDCSCEAVILKSPNSALSTATIEGCSAIKYWYQPKLQNGRKSDSSYTIPIIFNKYVPYADEQTAKYSNFKSGTYYR